ncbi:MAG: hypothetical protein SGILL_008163 [Bacillariaceae sp.]
MASFSKKKKGGGGRKYTDQEEQSFQQHGQQFDGELPFHFSAEFDNEEEPMLADESPPAFRNENDAFMDEDDDMDNSLSLRSIQLGMGSADDDEDSILTGDEDPHNNSSSNLSASERGDSLAGGSRHSLSSPFSTPVSRNSMHRKGSFRDLFIASGHGDRRRSGRQSFSIHELPLTRMDEHDGDDNEGSFEFGEESAYVSFDKQDEAYSSQANMQAYTDLDEDRINFDTSEYFETLEDDYFDALEENTKKTSSIRFAEKDDLIDDTHRSRNLGLHAPDSAALDIFEENVGTGDPLEEKKKPYPYVYDDDEDASMDEDMMGDEDSLDESDAEEKKIMRGIMYSVGGAAVLAGAGFLAKQVMSKLSKSEDTDTGGGEMFNGADQATAIDAAQETAHAAELAAEASQAASQAALEASLNASFNTSSSSGFAATGAAGGAQNSSAAAAAQ